VKTLVVSAFEPEIAPLRRLAAGHAARTLALLPVGIGPVEAAVGAARAIEAHRPARVIFVGTAGAYAGARPAAALGAVALATELILVSTAALGGDGYLPAPQVVRDESSAALRAQLRGRRVAEVPELVVACPLAITRSAALGSRIARATGARLENLEAFAVARAARAAGLPFAAVLGIANRVGPAGHKQWRDNHAAASRAACRLIAHLLLRA
jgi:futalosine hydrolase